MGTRQEMRERERERAQKEPRILLNPESQHYRLLNCVIEITVDRVILLSWC